MAEFGGMGMAGVGTAWRGSLIDPNLQPHSPRHLENENTPWPLDPLVQITHDPPQERGPQETL